MTAHRHWLTSERLRAYACVPFASCLIAVMHSMFYAHGMVNSNGTSVGTDYIVFWAASHLALSGHAASAYNFATIAATQKACLPALAGAYPWLYPPNYLLAILPLALLAYLPSFCAFTGLTLGIYLLVFNHIVQLPWIEWGGHAHGGSLAADRALRHRTFRRNAFIGLVSFTPLWVNFAHGQNAYLTAAIAAAALLRLKRHPIQAGILIGLLSMKPQLALLFPVALLAIGAWRTLAAAVITTLVFLGSSVLVFGHGILGVAIQGAAFARAFIQQGGVDWQYMPSAYSFAHMLGLSDTSASLCQAVSALLGALAVWRVWRRCHDTGIRAATLMIATFLISPYTMTYDLAWLAFPGLWLVRAGIRDGWSRGDREGLLSAWFLSLFLTPLAVWTHVQIGPFMILGLLFIALRRASTAALAAPTVTLAKTIAPGP